MDADVDVVLFVDTGTMYARDWRDEVMERVNARYPFKHRSVAVRKKKKNHSFFKKKKKKRTKKFRKIPIRFFFFFQIFHRRRRRARGSRERPHVRATRRRGGRVLRVLRLRLPGPVQRLDRGRPGRHQEIAGRSRQPGRAAGPVRVRVPGQSPRQPARRRPVRVRLRRRHRVAVLRRLRRVIRFFRFLFFFVFKFTTTRLRRAPFIIFFNVFRFFFFFLPICVFAFLKPTTTMLLTPRFSFSMSCFFLNDLP